MATANRLVVHGYGTGSGRSVRLSVVRCLAPAFAESDGIRTDLEQLLADTEPGFFRRPGGGNHLEGSVVANPAASTTDVSSQVDRPAWLRHVHPVSSEVRNPSRRTAGVPGAVGVGHQVEPPLP
ncbi:hypothetical protein [Kitasatospora sp. DSM 101779]|uniref:hypothetical protein n=1 Tax=Kitasatospora sp. DSM 101779 TaxID=2853165 RepID=UPI0021D9C476|nr:hypothetical protein [Kitasatospora sp. DSM 101779]MCU7826471.1 hypothetical protein [Kitasatospora sp. DSM 101779]